MTTQHPVRRFTRGTFVCSYLVGVQPPVGCIGRVETRNGVYIRTDGPLPFILHTTYVRTIEEVLSVTA